MRHRELTSQGSAHAHLESRWFNAVFALPLLALCLFLGMGCESTQGSKPVGLRTLRVGMSPDYPPVAFKQGSKFVGIEAELAYLVGVDLDVKIKFVELAWEELIPALEAEKIDVIMSGMSVSPGRMERVLFTNPYMEVGQMALIRYEDAQRIYTPSSLNRRDIVLGYQPNTTGALYVEENIVLSRHIPFPTTEEGVKALRAGEIDAFIHDAPTIWRYGFDDANRDLLGLYTPLTQEYLAWAVRPEDSSLQGQLNAALFRIYRSGSFDAIINKWIPVRVQAK